MRISRATLEQAAEKAWEFWYQHQGKAQGGPTWSDIQGGIKEEWVETIETGFTAAGFEVEPDEMPVRLQRILTKLLTAHQAQTMTQFREQTVTSFFDVLDILGKDMAQDEDAACNYSEKLYLWMVEVKKSTGSL